MRKKSFLFVFLLAFALTAAGAAMGQDAETPVQAQDEMDVILYGELGIGGVIQRLGKVETDLFGRELPGSISERQQGLLNFLRDGTLGQPSMIFKTGVAEWAVLHEVRVDLPLSRRVSEIERQLEGAAGEDRPLAMRLERILSLLVPGQVTWQDIRFPANVVFRTSFIDRISPKTAAAGDIVRLRLEEHLSVEGYLVAPRGSRIIARVDRVKPPRSFGRPSEITFAFDRLEPLGPDLIPVFLGDAAVLAGKSDKTIAAAAGTSALGFILLGPIGLAGGFLVKGDAPEIAPGTPLYLETSALANVKAYLVPPAMQGLLEGKSDEGNDAQLQDPNGSTQEGGVKVD
ncbi:MAG: hypothetical protein Q7I97_03995 [Thermovirgaceae bacterium]|nr:hypothetical protein [Thermovirgaceae bacterium]